MSNNLTVDLSSVMQSAKDNIKQRIKDSFTALIPDEVFTAMVETEIKWFITDTTANPTYYRNDVKLPSPLRAMIQQELENQFKDMIKTEVAKPEYWSSNYSGNMSLPAEAVKAIVKECIPQIVESAIGNTTAE